VNATGTITLETERREKGSAGGDCRLMYDGTTGKLAKSYQWDPTKPNGVGGLLCITTYDSDGSVTDNQRPTFDSSDNVAGNPQPTYDGNGYATGNYRPVYDDNANVVSLVNLADGTVAATYTYSAFGECTATGWQADVCLFRFGGMYWQTNAGCYYDKARDYMAPLGRFMQRDPIEEDGGYNTQAYCAANPINETDPTGLYYGYYDTSILGPKPVPTEMPPSPVTRDEWNMRLTSQQQFDWVSGNMKFRKADFEYYAKKHNIPKLLLAIVVLNEQADYTGNEALGESLGFGKSVGLSQMTVKTAISEGLSLVKTYGGSEKQIRQALISISGNLDASAELISKYLDYLSKAKNDSKITRGFYNVVGISSKNPEPNDLDCRQKPGGDLLNYVPSEALVQAMTSMWNYGKIDGKYLFEVEDANLKAPDSRDNGLRASSVYRHLRRWAETNKW